MHQDSIWATNLDGSNKRKIMNINNGSMFDYHYDSGRIYWVEDNDKVSEHQ